MLSERQVELRRSIPREPPAAMTTAIARFFTRAAQFAVEGLHDSSGHRQVRIIVAGSSGGRFCDLPGQTEDPAYNLERKSRVDEGGRPPVGRFDAVRSTHLRWSPGERVHGGTIPQVR
jgi:hypothetical protein